MPADTARAAQPATRLWTALLAADAPVTVGDLHRAVGTSFQNADLRLTLWARAGVVTCTGRRPRRYRLAPSVERTPMPPVIDAAGRATPRPIPAYQRIWSAIRVLRDVDLPALMMTAGTSERVTRSYLGLLHRTGYLRMTKLARPWSGDHSRYVLARNTGRAGPRETIEVVEGANRRVLVDPNTGQRHPIARGGSPLRRSSAASPADGGEG